MSWKITKKLKETHLAPISNPFSRSSSTSTIQPTPENGASSASASASDSASVTSSSGSSTDPKGIVASEAVAAQPQAPTKPGILVVTLHEGRGFTLEPEDEELLANVREFDGRTLVGSVRPNSTSLTQGVAQDSYGNYSRPKTAAGTGFGAIPTNHGRYSARYLPYALVDFDKQQVFINSVSGTPIQPLWAGDNTAYKFDVSRTVDLAVSVYIRNPNAPPSAGRSADICIGTCKIKPKYEYNPDNHEHPDAKGTTSKKEKDRPRTSDRPASQSEDPDLHRIFNPRTGALKGYIKIKCEFVETRQKSLAIDDFELLKVVGKGSFGKVMQVMKKDTHRIYALKTIRKAHIISRSEVSHTLAERSVLAQINNPFIVPLKFSFQSPEKLYFVLAFVNGGELFHHLQKEQRFNVNRARFYAAELLCALECLHGFNVIYRDLKPENILLDYSGHIALCDFGLCKLDMKDEDTTNTFCGTPEYLAPELLHGSGYTKTVDWWTLGVLLYEMLTGLPPFYDENTNEMYRKILTEPLTFPDNREYMPEAARDLLTKLLDRRPDKRLGVNGAAEIKAHDFFNGIDWRKLLRRGYEPLFKPNVADQLDTANFDREFTSEAPTDSYVDGPMLSQTAQQQFAGWSYNRPVAGLGDAGGSVRDPSFGSVQGR